MLKASYGVVQLEFIWGQSVGNLSLAGGADLIRDAIGAWV